MVTIKDLRDSRGWTQLEMGTKLGIRPESISAWENGRRKPSPMALYHLAQFFKVKPGDIELVEPKTGEVAE